MREALKQARIAADNDEVPVGAVIVHENKIIARAHNQVETLKDPDGSRRDDRDHPGKRFAGKQMALECALYVTLEPCSMRRGAGPGPDPADLLRRG